MKGIHEVAVGSLCKPLKQHSTSGCVPHPTRSLRTSMRRNLRIGVQGRAVYTGTAGACECRAFPSIATTRADAAHLLPGALPKGDALLDRGRHGAGESGSLSSRGSSPVATAASMPASRYPSRRSVRMTRRLMFWTTSATSAALGGSTLTKRGWRLAAGRSRETPSRKRP